MLVRPLDTTIKRAINAMAPVLLIKFPHFVCLTVKVFFDEKVPPDVG